MSAYVKSFNGESKWIHFLIENDELLKNVMTFWINSKIVFKKTDNEPIYNKNFWKPK